MAGRGQRTATTSRSSSSSGRDRRRTKHTDDEGLMPVLAKAVREVEAQAQRGAIRRSGRTKFQVIALLVREERARVKAQDDVTEVWRAEQLKRLDGIATILAKIAARDPSLLGLLAEDASVTDDARILKRDMMLEGGLEPPEELVEPQVPDPASARSVIPMSVRARQLANPFLEPDYEAVGERRRRTGLLTGWELLGPLFRSFEQGGDSSCMQLPEPATLKGPDGLQLMHHQGQLVAAAAQGHRSFLLADEPGLGKTAQALLAAQAANAFPLLVVVPNVVKTNWAREVHLWTPSRVPTVVHGDGENVDGFADIVIVNYEILDRHVGWLGSFGFRGMVVDEAHFIKNKSSQRSQNVLQTAERIRQRMLRPLMMALTGTPLVNDIEDFQAIWEFLGWIEAKAPRAELLAALEENGWTPADPQFYPAARSTVVDFGIVRRRKVDVASDIPARRIADLPVELDDDAGRSIREAEAELARRLLQRYDAALAARSSSTTTDGIDHELVRVVAKAERDAEAASTGENVFSLMRRIGQAKAGLAADYAAQLARSVGKVVVFAKHIDVMDTAQETFARRGMRYSSVRGDQTPKARQENIDAFTNDPDVPVIVCSLTAAGVGLNLQVASNVVLAELSWTDAEQTQAIDRVHRIGQTEPVTAWRIIAAQTLDTQVAQLIDSKAGLAARALDGSDEEVSVSADVQLEALVGLLTEALRRR